MKSECVLKFETANALLKVENLVTGLHSGANIVDGISFEIA